MILSFKLSMPNNNSWDRKWSGDGRMYVRTRDFLSKSAKEKAAKLLDKGSFYYNFGDGWGASVAVDEVTASEAKKLRAMSKGFCGYEWMIDSIVDHGAIHATPPRA